MLAVLIQSSCENDRKTVRSAGIRRRRKADITHALKKVAALVLGLCSPLQFLTDDGGR